jgi:D-alanyl-D-alanine carboxypeptidase
LRATAAAACAVGIVAVTSMAIPSTARAATAPAHEPIPLTGRGLYVDPRSPDPPGSIAAPAWMVADADSGAILAARDPHGRYLPASTLKILTAVTLLPTLPASRRVMVGNDAARVDGTRVGLVPGISYTVGELATAMLIASGNDAATALADAAGGVGPAVAAMNARARALGALDTHAGDPSGLDAPGETTSAFDLAVLGRAALTAPSVRPYLTLPHATMRGRDGKTFQIQNHNTLLGAYPGTVGVKNGYTVAAQATYVGAARRDGRTLIVTLLRTRPAYQVDARALLDWGFANGNRIVPVGSLDNAARLSSVAAASGARAILRSSPSPTASAGAGSGSGWFAGVNPVTWTAVGLTALACGLTAVPRWRRRAAAQRGAAHRDRAYRSQGSAGPRAPERDPVVTDEASLVRIIPRPARQRRPSTRVPVRSRPAVARTAPGLEPVGASSSGEESPATGRSSTDASPAPGAAVPASAPASPGSLASPAAEAALSLLPDGGTSES